MRTYARPVVIAALLGCGTSNGGSTDASVADGGRKGTETDMPRISMIVWFDIEKERDWLFDSSTSSANAFNAGFAQSRSGGVYWDPATGGL
jgi:hypothetical protein